MNKKEFAIVRQSAEDIFPPMSIPMDYSKKSLERIENLIQSLFPKVGRPQFPTTLMPFGFYLGETLVRNFPNASWVLDDEAFDVAVKIKVNEEHSIAVKPFVRALKFFEDRTDSIVAMYDMVDLQIKGGLDLDDANAGKWTRKDNLLYRFRKEDKPDGDHKN